MQKPYDAIIVGAGVIGSSIAYHLSKRGSNVLVLERGQVAGKASSAAAGMLGAQTELEEETPLSTFAKMSRAMFPQLAKELKECSGLDIAFQQNGIYKVAVTETDVQKLQRLVRAQQYLGEESFWVTPDVLQAREPALGKTLGAMFIPEDGHVCARTLTKAFAHSAVALGADIFEYTDVQEINMTGERVTGVTTSQGTFHAEKIIVAGGAWSAFLLKDAGVTLHTYPVKGECFSVKTKRQLVKGTIFSGDCYIVPKAGNRLIVGATERAHSFDETVSIDSLSKLMEGAIKILPELKEAVWEKAWAGIRPQTMDGIPYLGAHPEKKGLYITTGHYRNGILLSPITGQVTADLVEGKKMDPLWEMAFALNRTNVKVTGVEK